MKNNLFCILIWYGSGCGSWSSDPYLWLTDPDADPGGPKTYGSGTLAHLHHSSKIKIHKEVTKQEKSSSYYCCLMMERSGAGSGSVLMTNGSGRSKKYVSGSATLDLMLWVEIRDRMDPHWYGSAGSGSALRMRGTGSRWSNMTRKKEIKLKKCNVLKCSMFSFEGWRLLR